MAATPPDEPEAGAAGGSAGDLRTRVAHYLRSHHTMTLATMGPLHAAAGDPMPAARHAAGQAAAPGAEYPAAPGAAEGAAAPHAASVFYAVDDALRLVFLSESSSAHGLHIGTAAPVAVTVTEQYDDWELIQGVQLWGTAVRLEGASKVAAMAVYLGRFPFLRESMKQPRLAEALRKVAVYRVTPQRVAFTDNTTGVFGREALDLRDEHHGP